MNTKNVHDAAQAAALTTLAAKALVAKLRQHSAFEIDHSARCDRLIAIRSALKDRDQLPAEIADELAWRYAEAVLALSVTPSPTKDDLGRKVTAIGPLSRAFLPTYEAALIANAVIAALTADGQFLGVRLQIQAEPPPSSDTLN
ncbi:MAG: hypothetical protein O9306_08440 [Beijerinckiaceae bacterium]|jgi:hypothetical protein|nr:hypothetical protein [Beijerinckiaceae bacterium]